MCTVGSAGWIKQKRVRDQVCLPGAKIFLFGEINQWEVDLRAHEFGSQDAVPWCMSL